MIKTKKYIPKPTSTLKDRIKTDLIILHCTATQEGKHVTCDDVDKWHKQRNFSCIGYNFLIDLNGQIWEARGETKVGAHCTDYNSKSIGVVYVGGLDKNGKAKNTLNEKQKLSLFQLVEYLLEKYHLSINDVFGHRTFANKACPCWSNEWFRSEYMKWKDNKYKEYLKQKNCNLKTWY